MSLLNKNQNNQNQKQNNTTPTRVDASNIKNVPLKDLKDKYEYVDGYFRFQKDDQPIINRTEEQLKICHEFFIIENLKTTTCDPALKKRAQLFGTIAKVLLTVAIVMIVLAIVGVDYVGIVGILCLLAWIGMLIARNFANKAFEKSISTQKHPNVVMSDEEYESLVEKKIEEMDLVALAHERLGLDESQTEEVQPIIIKTSAERDYTLKYYNEKDRKLFRSTQNVTILFFTNEQLFVYQIVFDMCCNVQEEYTSEFFYDDICDVSSKINKNILKIGTYSFEYSTVKFTIIVPNSSIGFEIEGNSERLASVQAMKQKIRDKRNRE